MSLSFNANGPATGFAAVNSVVVNVPAGTVAPDLLIAHFAFDGKAAGSGPYISSANVGWARLFFQAPSALGSGLEVWWGTYSIGTNTTFNFTANSTGQTRMSGYHCASGVETVPGPLASAAVTGSAPTTPGITTVDPDTLVVIGGAYKTTAGFGTPAGYGNGWDNTRAGFGTIEGCIRVQQAPSPAVIPGATFSGLTANPAGHPGTVAMYSFVCATGRGTGELPLLGVG